MKYREEYFQLNVKLTQWFCFMVYQTASQITLQITKNAYGRLEPQGRQNTTTKISLRLF